jgi:hypothetical protein
VAHPLAVCELLAATGEDETVLAAALLHDAVEHSDLPLDDVVDAFGVEVGALVAALTEDGAIAAWMERKDALRARVAAAGEPAVTIYAADKLANLEVMRRIHAAIGPAAIDLRGAPSLDLRVDAWERDLAMVAEVAPRLALVDPLRRELTAFAAERDATRAASCL